MTPRHLALQALLESHQPTSSEEAQHLESIRGLLSSKQTAFDRDEYDPGHITASAFVVHPSEPAAALMKHRKIGRWLQPGGHVEPDDTGIEAAARREVAEEIGVEELLSFGVTDVDVHVFPRRGDLPQHLHLDVRIGFVARSERLVDSAESDGVRWATFTEMQAMEESLARPARRLEAMHRAGTLRLD
jgi:8-oxo-dGTP pyrophosphatase MutT (NUDIX family)